MNSKTPCTFNQRTRSYALASMNRNGVRRKPHKCQLSSMLIICHGTSRINKLMNKIKKNKDGLEKNRWGEGGLWPKQHSNRPNHNKCHVQMSSTLSVSISKRLSTIVPSKVCDKAPNDCRRCMPPARRRRGTCGSSMSLPTSHQV